MTVTSCSKGCGVIAAGREKLQGRYITTSPPLPPPPATALPQIYNCLRKAQFLKHVRHRKQSGWNASTGELEADQWREEEVAQEEVAGGEEAREEEEIEEEVVC
ncbi:hypothetical protein TYRP_001674 [Tyrophagus putrescentiae]|nr:hypothetical protein TYRP_001674 [Tyrophagus putrescentiae]